MSYQVTQFDLNLLKQSVHEFYLKVELLNKSMKVIDSLTGVVIDDNFMYNNDSTQRRSYSCTLLVKDSSFVIGKDKKIWMDKRIRVYYGIKSLRTKEIVWYRIGTFAYVSVDYKFTQTERTLSLNCADLMAEYDGTLNGQIGGYGSSNTDDEQAAQGITVLAGEDIRQSIIALLKDAHIENYIVEDIKKEIPYDLEFSTGVTYCEVWTEICQLYDSWEFFFDVDGTFIWQQIPNCASDPVVLDDHVMESVVIDESVSSSFDNIYNVTEVWGKVLELETGDRYSETSTYTNNTYNITLDGYSSWQDVNNLTKIAFKVKSLNNNSPKFSLNGYSSIPIYDGNGDPLKAGVLEVDNSYIFRYRRVSVNENEVISALYLLGQYQCYGKYIENSDDCPFSVKNLGYEILKAVDYPNLTDNAACYNQAEYLTYTTTAMMDTVTLTTLIIPWLEVNTKVKYTTKYNNETNQYIIKSISWNVGSGTMTLTLYKFLESFSFVYDRKHSKSV